MGKYRILVVDDDEDARRILALALGQRYETVEACDGLDALTRLEAYEPDLAIIDIMMPTMDGFQLCQAIRKHPRYRAMPVMFLSAYGSADNARKSYAVGGNLFLTKPVDPERVLKNIDFTIEHEAPPLRTKKRSVLQLAGMTAEDYSAIGRGREEADQGRTSGQPRVSEHTPYPRLSEHTPPPRPAEHTPPPRPIPAAAAPAEAAATGNAKPRILIVDDDPETRLMIDLALRDVFEITKAANGMEAIERLVDYEPDMMLVDIMMPKMNGYQLLQSIRRNPQFYAMPVVVLSAKSATRDREYAAKLGATDYLAKPYKVEELLASLERIMTAPGFRPRAKSRPIAEIQSGIAADARTGDDAAKRRAHETRYDDLREVIRKGGADPFARG